MLGWASCKIAAGGTSLASNCGTSESEFSWPATICPFWKDLHLGSFRSPETIALCVGQWLANQGRASFLRRATEGISLRSQAKHRSIADHGHGIRVSLAHHVVLPPARLLDHAAAGHSHRRVPGAPLHSSA